MGKEEWKGRRKEDGKEGWKERREERRKEEERSVLLHVCPLAPGALGQILSATFGDKTNQNIFRRVSEYIQRVVHNLATEQQHEQQQQIQMRVIIIVSGGKLGFKHQVDN